MSDHCRHCGEMTTWTVAATAWKTERRQTRPRWRLHLQKIKTARRKQHQRVMQSNPAYSKFNFWHPRQTVSFGHLLIDFSLKSFQPRCNQCAKIAIAHIAWPSGYFHKCRDYPDSHRCQQQLSSWSAASVQVSSSSWGLPNEPIWP